MSTALDKAQRVLLVEKELEEGLRTAAKAESASSPKFVQSLADSATDTMIERAKTAATEAKKHLPDLDKLQAAAERARVKRVADDEALRAYDAKCAAGRLPFVAAAERSYIDDITADNQMTRRRRDLYRALMPEFQVVAIQRKAHDLWEKWRAEANAESDWVVRAGIVAAMTKIHHPTGGSIANMLEGVVVPPENLAAWWVNHLDEVEAARVAATNEARAKAVVLSKQAKPAAFTPVASSGWRR